jgi:hypothetical protein
MRGIAAHERLQHLRVVLVTCGAIAGELRDSNTLKPTRHSPTAYFFNRPAQFILDHCRNFEFTVGLHFQRAGQTSYKANQSQPN